ncbi:MAG: hypothetical protein K2N62_10010 [Desulfovibrio sp.]|nr:hypothetical protein [Desulfovibrio sp.]
MSGIYEKIYVIGQGVPALACMKLVKDRGLPGGFLDTGGPMDGFSRKAAAGCGIAPERVSRDDLPYLFNETQRILVLSASNTIIFPKKIVEMENLRILNYHNSLLPAHRGMHAEAWAIFAGDPLAGISWHVVDSGIDTGPLVVQKSLPVGELTSLELLRRQCALAVAALSEYLPAILRGDAPLIPQAPCTTPPHKRAERPNAGVLDLAWPAKKIWNFLRAFDYGGLRTLGSPRCRIKGIWHAWEGYAPLGETAAGPDDWPIRSAGAVLKNIFPLRAADAGGYDAKSGFCQSL